MTRTTYESYRMTTEKYEELFNQGRITRGFVTAETMKIIEEILELDICETEIELRNIRNLVVILTSNKTTKIRSKEEINWEQYDLWNDFSSAVTSIIDMKIVEAGGEA